MCLLSRAQPPVTSLPACARGVHTVHSKHLIQQCLTSHAHCDEIGWRLAGGGSDTPPLLPVCFVPVLLALVAGRSAPLPLCCRSRVAAWCAGS